MADSCIVCLEDLEGQLEDGVQVPQIIPHNDLEGGNEVAEELHQLQDNHPGDINDELLPVAQIKPCGHVLHDKCLRQWSQQTNSCPICRGTFNLVAVLDRVGGTVQSEYAVEDRKQNASADFDLARWQEDNPEDDEEEEESEDDDRACPICDLADQEDVLLLCSRCDAPYHTHCIGLRSVPAGNWYCMECVDGGALRLHDESQGPARTIPFSDQNVISRTQSRVRRARRDGRQDRWTNAWGQVSSAIRNFAGVDLDFAEDDQEIRGYRDLQRFSAQEFRRWEQRLGIARRQGAGQVFRNAAPQLIRERFEPPAPVVETREERQAWGAMERAQRLEDTPNRRKRRRSTASSQASRSDATSESSERRQKRPRTRVAPPGSGSHSYGETSNARTRVAPPGSGSHSYGETSNARTRVAPPGSGSHSYGETSNARNRRRSTASSQASRSDATPEEPERKLKRPRTRIVAQTGSSSVASSSRNPGPQTGPSRRNNSPRRSPRPTNTINTNSEPTFLSSLLREVEMAPSSDDDLLRFGIDFTSSRANGATSPSFECFSSATSPASPASSFRSRAISTTPPPRSRQRSPPLSTSVVPDFTAVHYSPDQSSRANSINQTTGNKRKRDGPPTREIRQPQPRRQNISRVRSQDSSPVRTTTVQSTSRSENTSPIRETLSIEEKESINKMVKKALGPHWKSQKISKEEYADINRNVSRKLYELTADKSISDREMSSWEKIATSEVNKAVQSLTN